MNLLLQFSGTKKVSFVQKQYMCETQFQAEYITCSMMCCYVSIHYIWL